MCISYMCISDPVSMCKCPCAYVWLGVCMCYTHMHTHAHCKCVHVCALHGWSVIHILMHSMFCAKERRSSSQSLSLIYTQSIWEIQYQSGSEIAQTSAGHLLFHSTKCVITLKACVYEVLRYFKHHSKDAAIKYNLCLLHQ